VSVLDDILVGVRADLAERQERVSLDELKSLAARVPDCRNPVPLL
jgi:indole-3-glycerol phosphate synthase